MMPMSALAVGDVAVQAEGNVAEVTIGDTTTQYATLTEAITAAQNSKGSTVKLLKNVTILKNADGYSYGIRLKSGDITLDLNGHTIQTTGGASGFVPLYAVFYIENGSSLTVQDNSANGGGKIVQPNGGQAINVGGALTVESGVAIEVTSTNESRPGPVIMDKNCAVFLTGGGTANILGGTLTGKQGIYVKNGTLNVSGGMIRGKNSYALQVAQDAVTKYNSMVTLTWAARRPFPAAPIPPVWRMDAASGTPTAQRRPCWPAATAIRIITARSPHTAKTAKAWWATPPSRSAPQTSFPMWTQMARCRQRRTARC